MTFLSPSNKIFDVGCIYGRGDDHTRFEYFSAPALAYFRWRPDHVPDVIHGHDWSTARVIYDCERELGRDIATAITVHNLHYGADLIGRAMEKCTFATTVSPTYADEQLAGQGGEALGTFYIFMWVFFWGGRGYDDDDVKMMMMMRRRRMMMPTQTQHNKQPAHTHTTHNTTTCPHTTTTWPYAAASSPRRSRRLSTRTASPACSTASTR